MTTERTEPIPDNPAGANLPYRGAVDHGVPYTEPELSDEAHYHTGRPVEYLAEEKEAEPIPVKVVNQGAREMRMFNTSIVVLGLSGAPLPGTNPARVPIVPRDERRTRITLRNLDTEEAWIGGEDFTYDGGAFVSRNGWRLIGGQEITLNSTEALYGAAEVGMNVRVNVLIEYSQDVR